MALTEFLLIDWTTAIQRTIRIPTLRRTPNLGSCPVKASREERSCGGMVTRALPCTQQYVSSKQIPHEAMDWDVNVWIDDGSRRSPNQRRRNGCSRHSNASDRIQRRTENLRPNGRSRSATGMARQTQHYLQDRTSTPRPRMVSLPINTITAHSSNESFWFGLKLKEDSNGGLQRQENPTDVQRHRLHPRAGGTRSLCHLREPPRL